jgi:hypothetical protein
MIERGLVRASLISEEMKTLLFFLTSMLPKSTFSVVPT